MLPLKSEVKDETVSDLWDKWAIKEKLTDSAQQKNIQHFLKDFHVIH